MFYHSCRIGLPQSWWLLGERYGHPSVVSVHRFVVSFELTAFLKRCPCPWKRRLTFSLSSHRILVTKSQATNYDNTNRAPCWFLRHCRYFAWISVCILPKLCEDRAIERYPTAHCGTLLANRRAWHYSGTYLRQSQKGQ